MAVEVDTTVVDTIISDVSPVNTETEIPKWLDIEFLEAHLQGFFNNKHVKIVSFEVKPATARGENYASFLYRVKVTYTDEPHRFSNTKEVSWKTNQWLIKKKNFYLF